MRQSYLNKNIIVQNKSKNYAKAYHWFESIEWLYFIKCAVILKI